MYFAGFGVTVHARDDEVSTASVENNFEGLSRAANADCSIVGIALARLRGLLLA